MNTAIPRPEHPNPQFYRPTYEMLNGSWEFDFDDNNVGLDQQWYLHHTFSRTIQVPFAFQSKLSGIHDSDFHDIVWYRRTFFLEPMSDGHRAILHFGAVDYLAEVWVNGHLAGSHEGGHTPFAFDITPLLLPSENTLVVRAKDFSRDRALPRGKQYWEPQSASIFYTSTTGIWQSVWLETVSSTRIEHLRITPLLDQGAVELEVSTVGTHAGCTLRIDISYQNEVIAQQEALLTRQSNRYHLDLTGSTKGLQMWSPETPHLYDVHLELKDQGTPVDTVKSYFGLRKISVEHGRVLLNNRPYFLRLVLDQGYFPEGVLTAPSDDALRQDVELIKAMGFNGARKHQKLEDPRYLYWCDTLGLLVWGEMANAYEFSWDAATRLTREWLDAVRRDYNHPCIIAWVPLNESWGVPGLSNDPRQRSFVKGLYDLTKALDASRLVVSNDGWEHAQSDLCTIHDYEGDGASLTARYADRPTAVHAMPGQRPIYIAGHSDQGAPIIISEMGGISYKKSAWDGWGYSAAESEEDFIARYTAVVNAMYQSPIVQGFCYTQLTDVEQEINGLLTYDREPKVPLVIIRSITLGDGVPTK